jgi:branched-chain amino acid aminotransferase
VKGAVAMIDGVVLPLEDASVSVLDRGFLYGDSVFETIRTYGGVPFALGEHLERLERSAALVFIDLPVSRAVIADEVERAVRAAGNDESYIRVMFTRGKGELGLDPALAEGPLRVIIVTPLAAPPAALYESGIKAHLFRLRRPSDGTAAAGAKLGNYLGSVLAMRAARAVGAKEALVVDGEERVIEGATSNVFFLSGSRLVTPPLDAGILPGITRGVLLELASEGGFEIELAAPLVTELPAFEEMFVSSSIRELLAVVDVDGTPVGNGAVGPGFRRLLAAFRSRVRR